ncbi:MAG TPA: hypothetical protein VN310_15470 [Candidatus Dormibacteraeota bacterium]|jgi:hypothetical protein|nr:hypothetical protein [Candidatus Dormibacteraeota bacterium]
MPNPAVLLCDSDALIQFFLANEVRPFKTLRDLYGVQPAIVQEVDLELRWLGKYKDKFVHQLDKALKADILRVLDPVYFQSFLSTSRVGASWAGFQSLGAQYEGHVHRGEAYTFAAGVTLGLPALSNDFSAIKTLEANFLSLPIPVLRAFDLLAFCHQSNCLELKECEAVRSELLKNKEGMPKAFMHASFEDGLKSFSPRLRVGATGPTNPAATFSATLYIAKI